VTLENNCIRYHKGESVIWKKTTPPPPPTSSLVFSNPQPPFVYL